MIQPPRLGLWLVQRFCNSDLKEAFEGDLYELFLDDLENRGTFQAKWRYFFNILLILRFHRLRNKNSNNTATMGLLSNYLKVAVRDLKRHKVFTGINLVGLVAGFVASLFMLQFVMHEISFDRFHKKSDRIYRVINDRFQNGELIQHGTITYPTIGPLMTQDYPEVEAYTRMTPSGLSYLNYNDELTPTEDLFFVDNHFLDVFDFEVTHGESQATNLDEPFEMVITERFAKTLAGENFEKLTGSTIKVGNTSLTILSIVETPPINSHLQFDVLVSYATFIEFSGEDADKSMSWSDFYHYIVVKEGADMDQLHQKVAAFGAHYFKEGEVSGAVEAFRLQSLHDAHLDHTNEYEIGEVVNGEIVWAMLFITIVIVCIAWINFTNLTTSRVLQRAKEVGVRKSLGASRKSVIMQVAVESLVLNVVALVISIGICWITQQSFNNLLNLQLSFDALTTTAVAGIPFPLVFLSVFVVMVVLISIYPGSIVAAFRMQDVIKGTFKTRGEIAGFKRLLIIFQYCVSLLLIAGTLGVGHQINYMLDKDLGIDIQRTMIVNGPGQTQFDSTFIQRMDYFKSELSAMSGVSRVTASARVAGNQMGRVFQIRSSADPEAVDLTSNFMGVNHDFVELYGLKVLAGRDFEPTDHHVEAANIRNLVINEAAVERLKFETAEASIGRTINFWNKDWTIIGVVNDFHQMSMHHQIEPIFMMPFYNTYNEFSIKLTGAPTEGLLTTIEQRYEEVFPGNYFDYYFLEDSYYKQYESEYRMRTIVKGFTILSILIAILGLYGLMLIAISRKTKEIGLRRVLGASLPQVMVKVGKEFVVLVLLAIILGGPLSYLLLDRWQSNFAYAAGVDILGITIAAFSLLALAALVLIIQMERIARINPSESLRYE